MTLLTFAKDLSLPIDAVTQKIALLGTTGSGKSYTARRIVESMLRAGAWVIVLDGVGTWAGIRGGAEPVEIPMLGGLYADIPLEPTAGATVADFLCNRKSSAVLDVSQMIDADRTRFATAFAKRLFERMKAAPAALSLVLEECQDYVPQEPQGGENFMLHEFVRIAKVGRNFGMGVIFISQRPQEISKKALNLVECVLAFRMTGPHERKNLEYWLSDKGLTGAEVTGEPLSKVLPSLEMGKPLLWSPSWLKVSRIVEILPITTADTSQTPKVGATGAVVTLKRIHLDALHDEMRATLEHAKQNDPKLLRAEIERLKKLVAGGGTETPEAEPVEIEVPAFDLGEYNDVRTATERAVQMLEQETSESIKRLLVRVQGVFKESADRCLRKVGQATRDLAERQAKRKVKSAVSDLPVRSSKKSTAQAAPIVAGLPPGEALILGAAAQYGDRGVPINALNLITGYSTATRNTYIKRLRARGFVERSDGRLVATAVGRAALPSGTKQLPRGLKLIDHLIETLPEGEARILKIVRLNNPTIVPNETIDAETDFAVATRNTYIKRLITRGALKRQGVGNVRLNHEALG